MENKIYIDGEEGGVLEIKKEGIYTVIEAEISSKGELMRLYIQGDGKTAALGIMEPKGTKAVLKKRYSKIEMQKFPAKIEKVIALPYKESPPSTEKIKKPVQDVPKCNKTFKIKEKDFWIEENGTLFFVTQEGRFLAFPTELRKSVPGLRLKKYKNRQYMLFRY